MAQEDKLFAKHNAYRKPLMCPIFAPVLVVMAIISVSTMAAMAQDSSAIKAGMITHIAEPYSRSLRAGSLLLSPAQDTLVDTPYGVVSIDKGSVVLLVCSDRGLAVYDLLAKHSIAVKTGSDSIDVLPGHCAMLTESAGKSFEELNPGQFVGYRKLTSRPIGAGNKLWEAEFAVMSLVNGLPPIQRLLHSDDPVIGKKMDQMLRTDRQRMVMSPSREPFALYLAPHLKKSISDPPVSYPLGAQTNSQDSKDEGPYFLPTGDFPAARRPHIQPPAVSN